MRTTRRWTRTGIVGAGLVGLATVAFACTLQSDSITSPTASASKNATPQAKDPAYFEFQVEKAVAPVPGNAAPRYPDLLREAEIEGDVLAQFVVTADGRADMNTFKVLKTSHDLFTAAVMKSLPQMKFSPALVGGRPVKQLLQMPFSFSLSKTTGAQSNVGPAVIPRPRRMPTLSPTPAKLEGRTYFEFQVERAAKPRADITPPRYPDDLRTQRIEGVVLAQFVVDEAGVVDTATFKVLKSTHDGFTQAVRGALPTYRFEPALVGGRGIRQLVQMPFEFSLTKP